MDQNCKLVKRPKWLRIPCVEEMILENDQKWVFPEVQNFETCRCVSHEIIFVRNGKKIIVNTKSS